jgi:ABC-2 type transport system ATP-binding protein
MFGHDLTQDPAAVRRLVSLTGQFVAVDEDLTGYENLVLFARLLGYSRADAKARATELLDAFGLADASGRMLKTFSGGMRRRLDIAASIIITPRLLFLDEPTAGLDPRSRIQLWAIVQAIVATGTTVLLTTQYLEEADQLADRIAVIDHGRVIAEGTPSDLKTAVGAGAMRLRLRIPEQRPTAERIMAQALGVAVRAGSNPTMLSANVSDPAEVGHALTMLSRSAVQIATVSVGQPSLDDVFLALTGRPTEQNTTEKGTA